MLSFINNFVTNGISQHHITITNKIIWIRKLYQTTALEASFDNTLGCSTFRFLQRHSSLEQYLWSVMKNIIIFSKIRHWSDFSLCSNIISNPNLHFHFPQNVEFENCGTTPHLWEVHNPNISNEQKVKWPVVFLHVYTQHNRIFMVLQMLILHPLHHHHHHRYSFLFFCHRQKLPIVML